MRSKQKPDKSIARYISGCAFSLFFLGAFVSGCANPTDGDPTFSNNAPNNPLAVRRNREGYYAQRDGNVAAAEKAYKEARQIDPTLVEAYTNHAILMLSQGNVAEAENLVAEAMKVRPDVPFVFLLAGAICEKQGKMTEALPYYEKAAALFERQHAAQSQDVKTRIQYALTLMLANRTTHANEEMNRVLREFPTFTKGRIFSDKIAEGDRTFFLQWLTSSEL